MGRTNYTKVEEALIEGLLKMTVAQFLELADQASKMKKNPSEAGVPANTLQKSILTAVKIELNYLYKIDKDLYLKIDLEKADADRLIENSTSLTPEDWEKLKQIKEKIAEYRKDWAELLPKDEDIVEKERLKHINKRFNTNDDWLPLH